MKQIVSTAEGVDFTVNHLFFDLNSYFKQSYPTLNIRYYVLVVSPRF
jgi:hypothetical protein